MALVKLDSSVSLEFRRGTAPDPRQPLGEGGDRLHRSAVATRTFRESHGLPVRLSEEHLAEAPGELRCNRLVRSPTGLAYLRMRSWSRERLGRARWRLPDDASPRAHGPRSSTQEVVGERKTRQATCPSRGGPFVSQTTITPKEAP
jgi:hypothetical protein